LDETDTIFLLLEHGNFLEAMAENETPPLGAINVSRLYGARTLIQLNSDPDYIDHRGYTALQ